MATHPSRLCRRAALAALLPAVFLCTSDAVGDSPPAGVENAATADPTVARPRTTPCSVPLFSGLSFSDFSPKPFRYEPPAHCPGPFAKVVFEGDFAVSAGRQFDRTASIWVGGTNIYLGTTAEPSRTAGVAWHVERDLTDYAALLSEPHSGQVEIGNLVNATYTGVISSSARLLFYPLERGEKPPHVPDVVLPMAASADGGTVALATPGSRLARSFTLPQNIERAYLDVYAQSQAGDEFWYTCVPSDVADKLQSCAATSFREAELTIDGQPAGIVPIYPWIYTGGIDPYLWRPIPGVQTLEFVPYRADLTPFAGVLSNGRPHEVAISVFNANNHFATTATLLLVLDHDAKTVSGAVTVNTLAAAPAPKVVENLATAGDGSVSGSVAVRAARTYTISGYVHTARGKIETTIVQDMSFSNRQRFAISASQYVQDIDQRTITSSLTRTRWHGEERELASRQVWPLAVRVELTTNPDKSSQQKTTIRQQYERTDQASRNGFPTAFHIVSNQVSPTDTLSFDATGALIGKTEQKSRQHYFAADSDGGCYSKTINAEDGAVTAVTSGLECGR